MGQPLVRESRPPVATDQGGSLALPARLPADRFHSLALLGSGEDDVPW